MIIKHKGLEITILECDVNELIERNLTEDIEFSCSEESKNLAAKADTYKEMSKVGVMMAFQGDKTAYHMSTLLTNAFGNYKTHKIYQIASMK